MSGVEVVALTAPVNKSENWHSPESVSCHGLSAKRTRRTVGSRWKKKMKKKTSSFARWMMHGMGMERLLAPPNTASEPRGVSDCLNL